MAAKDGRFQVEGGKYLEYTKVVVEGPLDEIVLVIQQLAWFAAVFTLPTEHVITLSTAMFRRAEGQGSLDFEIIPRIIEIITLGNSNQPEITSNCWHRLFQGTVLACGFPISQRAKGRGVEIPFQLMTGLANITAAVQRDVGGALLIGDSLRLYAYDETEDEVQWHCTLVKGKDFTERLPESTKSLDLTDFRRLSSLRTFLGYYPKAEVLLGTEHLLRSHNIQTSGLECPKRTIELAREGTFSFGLTVKGIANGSLGGKWLATKTQAVSLEHNHDVFDLIDDTKDRQVILYDVESKCAWLVSALSLVLHIALVYLSQPSIQQRRSIGGNPISSPWPQLPYARPSTDGGSQARDTILSPDHYNLKLWNDNEKTRTFGHIVERVLKDFFEIRGAVAEQKGNRGWQSGTIGLRGWDFSDLATMRPLISQKELPWDKDSPLWWNLQDVEEMLVIFGKEFGRVIRPPTGANTPFGKEGIPPGARLLVASRPCIQQLTILQNRNHLLGQLAWKMRTSKCELHAASCACHAIYQLENPTAKIIKCCKACASKTCNGHTCSIQRELADFGPEAFVFGEAKLYHKSLKEQVENNA